MKKNMGTTDRVLRVVAAVIIAGLYYNGTITGTLGLTLIVLSVIFVLTSLVGFCPLYLLFGMNTCEQKKS